ncbi:MAG TPA: tetratricopeptide repeat protein [Methylomirabilota bacterium]|nr:tetratricopeptide repeat protein [Methylomirabilota bacterium]
MPVLLLGTAEIFLRMASYGYPTDFFLQQRITGRQMLIENRQFGWRFFPKQLARTPQPVIFPARKEPGTIRIFVFGESAAMGDPEPAFGLPRMLQAMLEAKFPSNRLEVINVAMTAINSHVVREIAKDCAPLEGDVWVIYMGNNEVVGPFGSGTVFGRQTPGLTFIRTSLWLKKLRLVQWLKSLGEQGQAEWGGMEMFLKQQVARDDPRMKTVYAHFRRNLEDIARLGTKSGAEVVLSTVAVNLKDSPPFASQHAVSLNDSQRTKFDEALARGIALGRTNHFAQAHVAFREARRAVPAADTFAELYFHLARCELALGGHAMARTNFNLAKEYDTLRFRADDAINAVIRDVGAQRRREIHLVDAADIFAAQISDGVPGRTGFVEHVHFTWEGNYHLARALLDSVVLALDHKRMAAVLKVATAEQCAERLAWTDWDRLQVYEEVRRRLQQPPFTAQFGHAERDAQWRKEIEALGARLNPENYRRTIEAYEKALQLAPGDWVLRENFAKLLEANGDSGRALAEWNAVARLLPHETLAHYHLGNLLDSAGRREEAIVHFRVALRRNPDSVETRNGLALALSNLGRTAEAEREFQTALRLKPGFTEARVNYGQLLARQGKIDAAIAEYENVLRRDTNSGAAHVNLGKLLNQRGDRAGAIGHYEAALRISPSNAVAHLNLGNAWLATNSAVAAEHYAAAIRAQPNFAEAHLALALESAKAGRSSDAEKHFVEAIRLQPASVDAHFNYGVLLANEKRWAEAARQFSETLKLQPTHQTARQFLERTERRL